MKEVCGMLVSGRNKGDGVWIWQRLWRKIVDVKMGCNGAVLKHYGECWSLYDLSEELMAGSVLRYGWMHCQG